MGIKQKPFRKYNLGKSRDDFTIGLNPEERVTLNEAKSILQQEKDATAIKQLAWIGAKTINDQKLIAILEVILNNYRKNKRLGIVTFD